MIKLKGRGGLKFKLLPVMKLLFKLTGRNYNAFYAWMLNRLDKKNTLDSILKIQPDSPTYERNLYDLSHGDYSHMWLLKREGLLPEHKVLDFGCGFGRTAVPFLRYLDEGKYTGTDLSEERIRIAKEYVEHEGLTDKHPVFIVGSSDSDVSMFEAGSYDFIWSKAVLGHMPFDAVKQALRNLKILLKPGGTFLADYTLAETDETETGTINITGFVVKEELMHSTLRELGYEFTVVEDWHRDPNNKPADNQFQMLKMTVPKK